MTSRPPDTLAGKQAVILDHLTRVVRWGHHHGMYTAQDVGAVAARHLPRPRGIDPRMSAHMAALKERIDGLMHHVAKLTRENDQLREINRRLNARLYPMAHDGHAVAYLTPRRAAVLTEAANGVPRAEIAEHLQTTVHNVSSTLSRAARDIGAADPAEAVALVAGGQVEVRAVSHTRGKIAS